MIGWSFWVLTTLATPVVPCGTDAHEPNDERRKSRLLNPPAEAATCKADPDWYKFHLDKGQTVEIVIDHHPTAKLSAPRLYRPGGRKPIGRISREKGRIRLTFRVRRSGNHRLRVAGADETRTVYSLSLSAR